MATWSFIVALFLVTMAVALSVAWVSKRRTEQRMEDDAAPKSALAADGPGPNPAVAPRGEDVDPSGGGVTPQGDRA